MGVRWQEEAGDAAEAEAGAQWQAFGGK